MGTRVKKSESPPLNSIWVVAAPGPIEFRRCKKQNKPFCSRPMEIIVNLLVTAALVLGISYIHPKIEVRNFLSALLVAVLLGVLNATLGLLLRNLIGVVTLGLGYLIYGVVTIIVTAIVLKIVDALLAGFKIIGFMPAIVMAVLLALGGIVVRSVLGIN